MPLPDPFNLDDLRAQRLKDEALKKIPMLCPGWTDYNVSDPGITLLELQAWMAEKLGYRLNRVPDKTLLRLMDLIGVDRLYPAESAKADVAFLLAAPFPLPGRDGAGVYTVIPAGVEVATRRDHDEPEVAFITTHSLQVEPLKISRVQLSDNTDRQENDPKSDAFKFKEPFRLFGANPKAGVGFCVALEPTQPDRSMAGYIVRLTFTLAKEGTRFLYGEGMDKSQYDWQYPAESNGSIQWKKLPWGVGSDEKDTTNNFLMQPDGTGSIVCYIPMDIRRCKLTSRDELQGDNYEAWWLSCKPTHDVKKSSQIESIQVEVLGGVVRAENAVRVSNELLGISDGRASQRFTLSHAGVLKLAQDEGVEVETEAGHTSSNGGGGQQWERWTRVDDFGRSTEHSRHYCVDEVMGEVTFGPAIVQRDGTVVQHGRVPPFVGGQIRISNYRYSLGQAGNVQAGKIRVLKTAIPYIDRVVNRADATGGLNAETVDEARVRARRVMQSNHRAVTPADYEALMRDVFEPLRNKDTRRTIARTKCLSHSDLPEQILVGEVRLVIVPPPSADGSPRRLSEDDLKDLKPRIKEFFNNYRLITTDVKVEPPQEVSISVSVRVAWAHTQRFTTFDEVRERLADVLQRLFAQTSLPDTNRPDRQNDMCDEALFGAGWEGWPFGERIEAAEVKRVLLRVPGVRDVRDVSFNEGSTSVELPPDGLPKIDLDDIVIQDMDGNAAAAKS